MYWENETYAGIGAGAHGYVSGTRYSNIGPIKRYMEQVDNGERPVQKRISLRKLKRWKKKCSLVYVKRTVFQLPLFHEKFGQSLEECLWTNHSIAY